MLHQNKVFNAGGFNLKKNSFSSALNEISTSDQNSIHLPLKNEHKLDYNNNNDSFITHKDNSKMNIINIEPDNHQNDLFGFWKLLTVLELNKS